MAFRIKFWLARGPARFDTRFLIGMTLVFAAACATGADGGSSEARNNAEPDMDAANDEEPVDEEDAAEPGDEEDASVPESPDAAGASSDASSPKDAGSDADPKDAGSDAPVTTPDASPPDAGQPDTGVDASRPPPAPLPMGTAVNGGWVYTEVAGARCRDGSPAGYYYRRGTEDLMILLGGSGACSDSFYCAISPKNVKETFNPDSLVDALFGVTSSPNLPVPSEDGILKRDSRNPVGSWSMVYVPYCTGDVHAGSNPNAMVPGVSGQHQFVGYTNMGLFLKSLGPSFPDTKRVLLAGTGGGGFGALLNMERTSDFFAPQGAKLYVVTDSGIPFQDQFISTCLQKRWRDLWNLNAAMPQSCTGCRNADGGGLAKGLGTYLFKEKFKDRIMGGLVTSREDDIIRLFFSEGLNNCSGGDYTTSTFQMGLRDVVTNVVGADRLGYYVLNGAGHMHLWRSRFYQENGLSTSVATWLADVLAEKPTHLGTL